MRPGEGLCAVLMLACVFLLLTSYYVLKTAREGLILPTGTFGLRGDELKTYASGAMALLLAGLVPAYGLLANRFRRIVLINVTLLITVVSLGLFYVMGMAGVSIGLAFFVWLGIVSVFLVAQFWSYANDIYTEEQGKRLFGIIAIGGSLGAIAGPRVADTAGTFTLFLIATGLLVAYVVVINIVERRDGAWQPRHLVEAPVDGAGGFALVLRDRYLLLIALVLLVTNVINTTGEYILSSSVREHVMQVVPDHAGAEAERRELIKSFYSDFFFHVNLLAFVIQALVVSRLVHRLGVRGALFATPIVVLGAYGVFAAVGALAVARAAKLAENSVDYSVQNTVRQMLFLPVTRAAKYKAKVAIDTFFMRVGDTFSALLVGFTIHQLALGRRALALANVALVVLWIALCVAIARRHRALTRRPAFAGEIE